MMTASDDDDRWPKTQWSMLHQTSEGGDPAERERAWRELVEEYRVPIKQVLRHYLAGRRDVDEAVECFFSYLFEQEMPARSDPKAGRFRAFVQGYAKKFAQRWRDGDTRRTISADLAGLENVEFDEPDNQAWLPTILDAGLDLMRPKDALILKRFHGLSGFERVSGEKLAEEMGVRREAVYKRVHGARERLGEQLRLIARQLAGDDEAWALEISWLEDVLEDRLPPPAFD